jgi:hypothetical protein
MHARQARDLLEPAPESDRRKHRIHQVAHDAEVVIERRLMVDRVPVWRRQQADELQPPYRA